MKGETDVKILRKKKRSQLKKKIAYDDGKRKSLIAALKGADMIEFIEGNGEHILLGEGTFQNKVTQHFIHFVVNHQNHTDSN
jgi:hypothetical protein